MDIPRIWSEFNKSAILLSSVWAVLLCLGVKLYFHLCTHPLGPRCIWQCQRGYPSTSALTLQSWRGSWYWLSSRTSIGCARERKREREREPGQDSALSLTSCTLSLRRGWRGSSLRPWQTLDRKLSPASPFDCPWTSAWPSHQECVAAVCCKCLHRVNSGLCTGPGLMNWANSNQVAWDTRLQCITLLWGWQASAGGWRLGNVYYGG